MWWTLLAFSVVPRQSEPAPASTVERAAIVWTRDLHTFWPPERPVLLSQEAGTKVWISAAQRQALLTVRTGQGPIATGDPAARPSGIPARSWSHVPGAWLVETASDIRVVVLPSGRVLGLDPTRAETGTWRIGGRLRGVEMAHDLDVSGIRFRIGDTTVTTGADGHFSVMVPATRGPLTIEPPELPEHGPTLGCYFIGLQPTVWGDTEITLDWFCPAPC
ncbi:MAG: hypothetical protein KTR31_38915 [Myxococcales bacterium]|nr:hypothetical protein [Myxococcales bacterium]